MPALAEHVMLSSYPIDGINTATFVRSTPFYNDLLPSFQMDWQIAAFEKNRLASFLHQCQCRGLSTDSP